MKKLLAILMAIMLVAGFAGCSDDKTETKAPAEKPAEVKEEKKFEVKEVVSKDGKEFTPDITTEGKLETKTLSDETIELCGKTYTMPVKVSDLMNDGWALGAIEFKNEFKPKMKTTLASFSMKNAEGAYISLGAIYNDTDEVQKLEDCLLIDFNMSYLNSEATKVDFVFPGGVTKGTTAHDVLSVYGDPNDSELFTGHSYNLEKQLTYTEHKDTGLSFSYSFEEDGVLSYAKVSAKIN